MSESRTDSVPIVGHRRPVGRAMVAAAACLVLAWPGMAAAEPAPDRPETPVPAQVEQAVTAELAAAGSTDFWVVFEDRADLSAADQIEDWGERGEYVHRQLTRTARASQAEFTARLTAAGVDHQPFWIANTVLVRAGDPSTLQAAQSQPGVAEIRADEGYELPEPVEGDEDPAATVDAVEWGIANIGADRVWADFSARGEGVVVGNIDSGVEYTHPALVEQYRGNNGDGTFDHDYHWWDPAQVCGDPSLAPCDNHSHGTHTMGTMVGDDGAGNQIGVAPRAQWIAAKGCESSSCSVGALLSSGQFMLAPTDLNGANPRPDLRPHIVNNSWGDPGGNPWYDQTVAAWVAAGIFPVFSNGNSGPGCGTTGSPADGPDAYAVGAYDINNGIALFSSRGPGRDEQIRPDISAPGVDVRSSVPGGFANFSGTSMAAPHLAGTVALIWSAAPAQRSDVAGTRELLDQTAVDTEDPQCGGEPADNNVYGEGRLDAYAAVLASPRGPAGGLTGTVTDAATGDPLAGARVSFDVAGFPRSTRTGADGSYAFPVVPVGDYQVSAVAFGYAQVTAPAEVVEDQTTTRDFPLDPVSSHPVTGTVTDDLGAPVAGARVTIIDTPLPPATTDQDGRYRFDAVPEGGYTTTAFAGGCLARATSALIVGGPTILDVSLAQQADRFGHTCRLEPVDWIDATDPLPPFPPFGGFGDLPPFPVAADLPFAFPFYGEIYAGEMQVAHSGFLSFQNFTHDQATAIPAAPLPNPVEPQAVIYPFGDSLQRRWGEDPAQVLTGVVGAEGDQRFVVEWRDVDTCAVPYNVLLCNPSGERMDFQVILHQTGEIVLQYRNLDSDRERGSGAVIGIESADGTDALQYSYRQPLLSGDQAIRFTPPATTMLYGAVADANDQAPVGSGTVTATNGETTHTVAVSRDGGYGLPLAPGIWQVEFTRTRYQPETREITVGEGLTQLDVALRTAAAAGPDEISRSMTAGERATVDVTLANSGSADLDWWTATAPGRWSHEPGPPPASPGKLVSAWPFNEKTGVGPLGITYADGRVWVGYRLDRGAGFFGDPFLREFTLDGRPTGREIATGGDLGDGLTTVGTRAEFVPDRGWLCLKGGADGEPAVVCLDPDDGSVVGHFLLPPTESSSDLAAHNPDQDIFFLTGPRGTRTIYQVAGFSHPTPGQLVAQCRTDAPQDSVTDLSYHRATHTLWHLTGGHDGRRMDQLDPDTCEVVGDVTDELPENDVPIRHLNGMEVGEQGALWFAMQTSFHVAMPNSGDPGIYQMAGGVPELGEVPWLEVAQPAGTLAPDAAVDLQVTIDTTELATKPGIYTATLVVASGAGRDPRLQIPIRVELHPDGQQDVIPPAAWATLHGEQEWGPSPDFVGGPDQAVRVILAARDNYEGAGVDTLEYRRDGSDWLTYDQPFLVSEPADHTVTFRATDKAGNTSPEESVTFTIAAGRLVAEPAAVAVRLPAGGTAEQTLRVTNTGSRPASLSLLRQDPDPAPPPAGGSPPSPPEVPGGTWTEEPPNLPERLRNPRTAVVGDFLYAFGGVRPARPLIAETVYALDLTAGTEWVRLRDMPEPLFRASLPGVIDGKVYLAAEDKLWIYDPVHDSWRTGTGPAQRTEYAGSAVVDGQLYLVGGIEADRTKTDATRRYDPVSDSWEDLPSYPLELRFQSCGGIDGRVYCTGGHTGDAAVTDTYMFDPADEQAGWQRRADQPIPLHRGAHAVADGMLLLAGGHTGAEMTDAAYAYHAATDSWSPLPPTSRVLIESGGACGPGGFYKVGGGTGTTREIVEVLPGSFRCGMDPESRVPWLSVEPASARLAPGESVEVTVRFDAGAVTEPGTYTADLALVDLTPYAVEPIPVSMTVPEPVACDRTVKRLHLGRLTVRDGVTCVADGALVLGPVSVRPGAGLVVGDATVLGPVTTDQAAVVDLVGGRFVGPVTVRHSTGPVMLSGTRVLGPVRLEHNATGEVPIVVSGNRIIGPLRCHGNQPPPTDQGVPNQVSGPTTGQCRGW